MGSRSVSCAQGDDDVDVDVGADVDYDDDDDGGNVDAVVLQVTIHADTRETAPTRSNKMKAVYISRRPWQKDTQKHLTYLARNHPLYKCPSR